MRKRNFISVILIWHFDRHGISAKSLQEQVTAPSNSECPANSRGKRAVHIPQYRKQNGGEPLKRLWEWRLRWGRKRRHHPQHRNDGEQHLKPFSRSPEYPHWCQQWVCASAATTTTRTSATTTTASTSVCPTAAATERRHIWTAGILQRSIAHWRFLPHYAQVRS